MRNNANTTTSTAAAPQHAHADTDDQADPYSDNSSDAHSHDAAIYTHANPTCQYADTNRSAANRNTDAHLNTQRYSYTYRTYRYIDLRNQRLPR